MTEERIVWLDERHGYVFDERLEAEIEKLEMAMQKAIDPYIEQIRMLKDLRQPVIRAE